MKSIPKIQLRKTPYTFTVVTIEVLKEDKEEIVALIKEHTNEVKDVMNEMVSLLDSTERTCTTDLANDALISLGYFDGASEKLAEQNRLNGMAIMAAR